MHPVKLVDIKRVQTHLSISTLDSAVVQTNFDFTFDFVNWHIKKGNSRLNDYPFQCQHFVWNILNLFALRHFLTEPTRDHDLVWVQPNALDEITKYLSEAQIEMHL